MKFEVKKFKADLIVVGAGIPGMCTAIQAARLGLTVALINDRGVLGGNASAEIGVPSNGSNDGGIFNLNSREGGICSEILHEYKYRSPVNRNRYIMDGVFIDIINAEKNIKVFLNTCIDEVEIKDSQIIMAAGTQNTTETRWEFYGKYFVDSTGDGTLGYLAGAEYMLGREGKDTFGEKIAPDVADRYVNPSTLMFWTTDVGYEIPYVAPKFAMDVSDAKILKRRIIPQDEFYMFQWYYEIGGEYDHVKDREEIIADHKALIYGIWDYIKNSGKYPQSATYDFSYVGCIPGTREYRRLVGDYILTEHDLFQQHHHDDVIGHGGWSIDLHAIKGFFDENDVNISIQLPGIYQIPYRTLYSKNITNMFMSGRCMSTSHVAFGSVRVISTLATGGQAVGAAAYLCKKYNVTPREIYTKGHYKELQQILLREDQLLIWVKNTDENDLARKAKVETSSTAELKLTEQVNVNGDEVADSIKPFYRRRVGNAYRGYTDYKTLDTGLALSLPIVDRIDALKIKVRVKEDTILYYNVCRPKLIENYSPEFCLYEGEYKLKANNDFQWVELPIGVESQNHYLFIEIKKNPLVDVAIGGEPMPTTQMFRCFETNNPRNIDYKTMKPKGWAYSRSPFSMCFEILPKQNVYGGENVVNGYNRAYGKPNMWLSEKSDSPCTMKLKWEKPVNINSLQITFAPDTTQRIHMQIFKPILDLIAHDYTIRAKVDGKWTVIQEVKDNHEKVNKFKFREIITDELEFVFTKSNTGQIGVYEVRVYNE